MARQPDVRRGFFTTSIGLSNGSIKLEWEGADQLVAPGETITRLYMQIWMADDTAGALAALEAPIITAMGATLGSPPSPPPSPRLAPSDGAWMWWERQHPKQFFTTGGDVIAVVRNDTGWRWESESQRKATPPDELGVYFAWDDFGNRAWFVAIGFSAVVLLAA